MTINELLDIFPDNFIQCHRKYIVNLHHFYSYDKSTFIIQVGKHSIPLGRKHKKDIEEQTSFDLKFFIQIPRWNPSGDRSVSSYDTLLYMQL